MDAKKSADTIPQLVDVIIPLGTGSKSNNDELRLCLRSLDTYAQQLGRVIIVTSALPNWVRNCYWVNLDDPLKHNKDGNIIRKVLAGLDKVTTEYFCWTCDDFVLLKPYNLATMPQIYNVRNINAFKNGSNRWSHRVHRTLEFIQQRTGRLPEHNYESHTIQRYKKSYLIKAMQGIDYQSDIGYSINTLFCGVMGICGGVDQRGLKCTCENNKWKLTNCSIMAGYNDQAFLHGLREELFKRFPNPSKYERQ